MVRIELLDASHDRTRFDCGVEALNRYLQQIARQHIAKGISKTFVAVEEGAAERKSVLGFFTISLCQVMAQDLPVEWAKKLPAQIPATKLLGNCFCARRTVNGQNADRRRGVRGSDPSGIRIRAGAYWEIGHAGDPYILRIQQAWQNQMSSDQWWTQEHDIRLFRPELQHTNRSNLFQNWTSPNEPGIHGL